MIKSSEQFLTSTLIPVTGKDHLSILLDYLPQTPHLRHLDQNSPNLTIFNPDLETVTIGMVREVIKELSFVGFSSDVRAVAILAIDQATLPALNALLKVLEEPPINTQIILTAANTQILLPTILSRCNIWEQEKNNQSTPSNIEEPQVSKVNINDISSRSISEAIDRAEKYKDREEAKELIINLIKSTHQINSDNPTKQHLTNLKTLEQTLTYLRANCNVRLAMENCFIKLASHM